MPKKNKDLSLSIKKFTFKQFCSILNLSSDIRIFINDTRYSGCLEDSCFRTITSRFNDMKVELVSVDKGRELFNEEVNSVYIEIHLVTNNI